MSAHLLPTRRNLRPSTPEQTEKRTNRLELSATIVSHDELRYTPAGIPALSLTFHHASMQDEAGGQRKVELEIAAVAFGKIAEALAKLPTGTAIRCEGFLARRYRTGTTLSLHIDHYRVE